MLKSVDLDNIRFGFTASFINAPWSYHTTHGHLENWLTLADHLKTPARIAEKFHIRRNIDTVRIANIGDYFSFQCLARELVSDLRESREKISLTFKSAFSEETTLFFAINPNYIKSNPAAENSGFILLTAKYKNESVASMRWSHDAYMATPCERANLRLVSSTELTKILSSRPTWQEKIMCRLASELKTIEHHHTYSLKHVKGVLEELENLRMNVLTA